MKLSIASIISLLREAAENSVDQLPAELADPADTVEWEAADLIEELVAILRKVAAGEPGTAELAELALDDKRRVVEGMKHLVEKLRRA
jgi:hypothetical protein